MSGPSGEPTEPMAGASSFDGETRAALAAGARAIAETGMVPGSAGNLSIRRDDRVLMTPRGAKLGEIDPATLVDVALDDGTVAADHSAPSAPSSESALHRSIYAACEATAIVHTHSHFGTVLGTLVDELPAIHYVVAQFGGPVRVARYETFGTEELAASVTEALTDRSAALMANHGAVVTGQSIEQAVDKAINLEWLASVYYHAMVAGSPKLLTEADLAAVVERARSLRRELQAAPA
jgi:L-fuculose-phosphate aldolase